MGSMRTSSLLFLEPPYQSVRRLTGSVPALGTVALFDTTAGRPSTNELKVQMETAPWCPVCLLATPDSGVRSVRRLARTCVVFGLDDGDGASAILKAVAQRPRPTASDLAEWVTRRTRLPTLSRVLADLFSRPAFRRNEATMLPYAVREQLRRLGDWSAQEWQVAGWLTEMAADRSLLNRTMCGSDDASVTMRRHMVELLGVSESQFHDRYGWEWVLECALQRSGFFDRTRTGQVHVLRSGWEEAGVLPRATA